MLYPEIDARQTGWLMRPDGHELYWEEIGNPDGIPVIFLHGGPGGGISPSSRRFFDPEKYRVILFDQRGCGKSRPFGKLENNTTQHLIADIEALRTMFGISKWLVFGGSWGSTLALAYGQAHPETVLAFVLRGIFLCRDDEISWFMNGMGRFYREAEKKFLEVAGFDVNPGAEALLARYGELFEGADGKDAAIRAARTWASYEAVCCTVLPDPEKVGQFESGDSALALARLEHHYFVNRGFFSPDQLLNDVTNITDFPAIVVQGRHDVVCPPTSAFALCDRWPKAKLVIVEDAGHSAGEPGITKALIQATDSFMGTDFG